MKRFITLTAIILSAFSFGQTGMKFEESTFKVALEKAKKEKKLIFLDAYATWCGPCKLMVKNIFPLQSVGDYYNSNFINTKLDMEKGEGLELAKKYGVKVYPTYLFIDGDGKEVHRTVGYVKEEDFIQFGKDAINPEARLTTLVKRFEDGEKDPVFLKDLAFKTMYSDQALFSRILGRYFEVNAGKELTKEDINLLLQSLNSVESETYKIFKEKKTEIEKVIKPEAYTKINNNLLLAKVYKNNYNKDTKVLNEKQYLSEAETILSKDEAQKALLSAKAKVALAKKDIPTWQNLMIEKYKDVTNIDPYELNDISWRFFENVTDKTGLLKAITWAEESVKKLESAHNTDTLANLYNKVGDKANAKKWATKSIELAKAKGDDYADTKKILDSL